MKKFISSLRNFRVWHRTTGLVLAVLVLISAITGILLSLKKDIDLIQPPTQKGVSTDLQQWLPMSELAILSRDALYDKFPEQQGNEIDRMDVRPSKGIVKVLFEKGNWEVQIDGSTGTVKSIARRHSDWIESLHDGSIVSDVFKLISMNVLGFGLLLLMITGIWLWYGPRKIRALKRTRPNS